MQASPFNPTRAFKVIESLDRESAADIFAAAVNAALDADWKTFLEGRWIDESDIIAAERKGDARAMVSTLAEDVEMPSGSTTELLRALTGALENATLSGYEKEVIERAGDSGKLHNIQYQVTYSRQFVDMENTFRINRSQIESAVHNANDTLHLMPPASFERAPDSNPLASIFLRHPEGNNANAYSLLAVGGRRGKQMEIHAAFRVYHEVFSNVQYLDSLKTLECFLEKCGVLLKLADGRLTRLVVALTVEPTESDGQWVYNLPSAGLPIKGDPSKPRRLGAFLVDSYIAFDRAKIGSNRKLNASVTLNYGVDMESYWQTFPKVSVPPSP